MGWIEKTIRVLTGAAAREAAAQREEWQKIAAQILGEHEARDHFDAQGALDRLESAMPEAEAKAQMMEHCRQRIQPVIVAALEDGLLSPEEESRINSVIARYGSIQIDEDTKAKLANAKAQYAAWVEPLAPLQVPLLLKRDEWCAQSRHSNAQLSKWKKLTVWAGSPALSCFMKRKVGATRIACGPASMRTR